MKSIHTPLTERMVEGLIVREKVEVNGIIYAARDAAHKRMIEALERGEDPPFDLMGQVIYYVGPTPPRPGMVIGSAGPTTSVRMDRYMEPLLMKGLKASIGKGRRTQRVIDLMVKYRAVYFVATGGAGALLSKRIRSSEVVAFGDLGPEAVFKLEVEHFPVIVANDIYGNDIFLEGVKRYSLM